MSTKNFQTEFVFIIPTLSNREGLRMVLQDIQRVYSSAHVVIINNNTRSLMDIENLPTTQILTLEQHRNTGFAKGCNDGAKAAREHFQPGFLVFLNDDVRFTTEWVGNCIKTMEKHRWFATTPLLKKPDGTIENVGYKVLPQGKILELKATGYKERDLDGLTAAALVIKTVDFFALKGFDERFFAYLEDVDLFLRAKKTGKKFGTTTTTFVIHAGQNTSSTMKMFKAWLDLKNWYLLIAKHWSREELSRNFIAIVLERLRNISGLIKSLF